MGVALPFTNIAQHNNHTNAMLFPQVTVMVTGNRDFYRIHNKSISTKYQIVFFVSILSLIFYTVLLKTLHSPKAQKLESAKKHKLTSTFYR